MSMVNCIRFRPKKSRETLFVQGTSKIYKNFGWSPRKTFSSVKLRRMLFCNCLEEYRCFSESFKLWCKAHWCFEDICRAYDDGEEFHAFSGQAVYLNNKEQLSICNNSELPKRWYNIFGLLSLFSHCWCSKLWDKFIPVAGAPFFWGLFPVLDPLVSF